MNSLVKYNERPLLEGLSRLESLISGTPAWINVEEKQNAVDVDLDLPGIDKEDIEIFYDHDILDICASRNGADSSRGIRRTISLPGVEPGKAEASLENGVLSISFPKKERPSGTEIKIN